MKLLPIDSGILGAASVSSRLSAAARLPERYAEASIVCSGLVSDCIDHLQVTSSRRRRSMPAHTRPRGGSTEARGTRAGLLVAVGKLGKWEE